MGMSGVVSVVSVLKLLDCLKGGENDLEINNRPGYGWLVVC